MNQHDLDQQCQELYAALAPEYERQLVGQCGYRTPTAAAELLERAWVGKGDGRKDIALWDRIRWLDLGAGTGLFGSAVEKLCLPLSLVAVDRSREMLAEISSETYVACFACDVLSSLPFDAESCDGASAIGLSEHLWDLEPLFSEVSRVLRPGAWFLLSFVPAAGEVPRIFEPLSGLVEHPRKEPHRLAIQYDLRLRQRHSTLGYQSGPEWIPHEILLWQRSQA